MSRISEWETQQNGWTRTAQVLPNIQQVTQQEEGMEHVKVKFLCGADLLESFAVPNLWDPNDVRFVPYMEWSKNSGLEYLYYILLI